MNIINKPKYFARAQFNGVVTRVCIFCGHINAFYWKPIKNRFQCKQCERQVILGLVEHIPASGIGKMPYDTTIPRWADDEYVWDAIPPAIYDPKLYKAGGRVNLIVLHEGVWFTSEGLPESAGRGEEALPEPV